MEGFMKGDSSHSVVAIADRRCRGRIDAVAGAGGQHRRGGIGVADRRRQGAVGTCARSGKRSGRQRHRDERDRPRIAWKNKARLFVSVHCNSSGLGEDPRTNNGNSVYWYQPQSEALAAAIHAGYRKNVPILPDRGLYFADFAVCRMTQMPAILTEQAYGTMTRSR